MGFLGFLKKGHAKPASDLQFKQEKPKDEFNAVPVPPDPFKTDDVSPNAHPIVNPTAELPEGLPEQPGLTEKPGIEQTPNSFEDFPPSQPDNPLTAEMIPEEAPPETDFSSEPKVEDIGPGFNQDTYPGPQDNMIPQQLGGIEDMLPQIPDENKQNPFMEGPGGFALPDLPSSQIEETVSTAEQTFDDHQEFMPPEKEPVTEEPMAAEAPGPQTSFSAEPKQTLPELPEQGPGPDILADQGLPKIKYVHEQDSQNDEPDDAYINSHQFFSLLQDIKGTKKYLRDADTIMRNWGDVDQQLELQSKAIMQHVDEMQEKLITIDTELFERGE